MQHNEMIHTLNKKSILGKDANEDSSFFLARRYSVISAFKRIPRASPEGSGGRIL